MAESRRARLASNLGQVRERMALAAGRSGRRPNDVRLVAVTKYAQPAWILDLLAADAADDGVRETRMNGAAGLDLGESRPQQLLERAGEFAAHLAGSETPYPRWHLIGHLQRNKVRKILPEVSLIHSADSLKLLGEIDRVAGELGLRPRLLLEVNAADDPAKDGFAPAELERQFPEILSLQRLEICGLMTMAALTGDAEQSRRAFRELRLLRDRLQAFAGAAKLTELSMGMTGDFEAAIEEGATLVRIGSALWEGVDP